MNIIFDGNKLTMVRASSQECSLDDIIFFVDKLINKYKLYMIIKDSTAKFDVVELKQTNTTNTKYYNYICSMDCPVKIESGKCELSLLGIDIGTGLVSFSTQPIPINLQNDTYNFKTQISLIEQFSKNAASTYNKMLELYNKVVALSNLNIDMLKEQSENE